MLDKCDAEYKSIVDNGMQPLLCEFHAVKLLEEKIPKYFKNEQEATECFRLIKKIQRSISEADIRINVKKLTQFCQFKSPKFGKYFCKEWLEKWKYSWVDLYRPG